MVVCDRNEGGGGRGWRVGDGGRKDGRGCVCVFDLRQDRVCLLLVQSRDRLTPTSTLHPIALLPVCHLAFRAPQRLDGGDLAWECPEGRNALSPV